VQFYSTKTGGGSIEAQVRLLSHTIYVGGFIITITIKRRKKKREVNDWPTQENNMLNLSGNTNCRERLSTIDLLVKVACFVKIFLIYKAANLN